MWCDLGESVGSRTCDIFSFLFVLIEVFITRGTFCWKPHLNRTSGSKVIAIERFWEVNPTQGHTWLPFWVKDQREKTCTYPLEYTWVFLWYEESIINAVTYTMLRWRAEDNQRWWQIQNPMVLHAVSQMAYDRTSGNLCHLYGVKGLVGYATWDHIIYT